MTRKQKKKVMMSLVESRAILFEERQKNINNGDRNRKRIEEERLDKMIRKLQKGLR